MESTVDLPQPEWPMMQTNSPSLNPEVKIPDDDGTALFGVVAFSQLGEFQKRVHGIFF